MPSDRLISATTSWQRSPLILRRSAGIALSLFLIGCLAASLVASRNWPLVGDASLMHYVVFLMHQGWAPYRQIIDINQPGAYFFEACGMRLFGDGAAGWRVYDAVLLLICSLSAFVIFPREDWLAAASASGLFWVIHLQDGLAQAGQRDLAATALLGVACALLIFKAPRPELTPYLNCFGGLLIGAAATIKPPYLAFTLLPLASALWGGRTKPGRRWWSFLWCLLGIVAPLAFTFAFLHWIGADQAYWNDIVPLMSLHASLGRKTFGYLLTHCLSPIGLLGLPWVAVVAVGQPPISKARALLALAAATSLALYFLQGKGYPYHRYPFLYFVLLLMVWDMLRAARKPGVARYLGLAGLIACCIFSFQSAGKVRSFSAATPMETALTRDLVELGGQRLSGRIQCLDTFAGCTNSLYNLRLLQSSGFLYDCYLFTPSQNSTSLTSRRQFWEAYRRNPPQAIVLTSQFCFGQDSFQKIANWPEFSEELDRSYKLVTEWVPSQPQHWWSRKEYPASFRIYLRSPGAAEPGP